MAKLMPAWLKKWGKIVLVVVVVALAVVVGFWFGKKASGTTEITAFVARDIPIAELATREISWQVAVHVKENFPAREYAVSRVAVVKAGFNLQSLSAANGDFKVNNTDKTVDIYLPQPKILSVVWKQTVILHESHSLVAAALTPSAFDEERRHRLFESALLVDLEQHELLSFDSMTEGLKKFLDPIFASHGLRPIYHIKNSTDFRSALRAYFLRNR